MRDGRKVEERQERRARRRLEREKAAPEGERGRAAVEGGEATRATPPAQNAAQRRAAAGSGRRKAKQGTAHHRQSGRTQQGRGQRTTAGTPRGNRGDTSHRPSRGRPGTTLSAWVEKTHNASTRSPKAKPAEGAQATRAVRQSRSKLGRGPAGAWKIIQATQCSVRLRIIDRQRVQGKHCFQKEQKDIP